MRLQGRRLNKAVLSKGANVCFYVNWRGQLRGGGYGRTPSLPMSKSLIKVRIIDFDIDFREISNPMLK